MGLVNARYSLYNIPGKLNLELSDDLEKVSGGLGPWGIFAAVIAGAAIMNFTIGLYANSIYNCKVDKVL
jgi:lactobin A/cerein 7B family class IIb bacteriocin